MDIVLLVVEEVLGGDVESFLLGGDDADGDEEAEESDEGEHESHDLPEDVVATVSLNLTTLVFFGDRVDVAFGVDGNVSGEVPHHEGPEAPGDEVLNGEGPPSDEDVVPPLCLLGDVLVVARGNHVGEFVSSVEEDILAPSLASHTLGLDEERDNPSDDHDSPEGHESYPLEVEGGAVLLIATLEGKDGHGSHDDGTDPVGNSDDFGRGSVLRSEHFLGAEEPGSGGTLSHTQDEHEVNGNVAIDDVEVGESPRGAEKEGSEPSENADNEGSELSGDLLATLSVVDDSGDGLNKGEGGVNSESEQSQTKNEGPEVRSGESLSSGGVGGEGESGGAVVLSDGGSNPLEVTHNGEYRETGKEGEGAVTEGDDEDISDDGLVSSVVGGVRSHDSHAHSEGEENLSNSIGPHLAVTEHLLHVSSLAVNLSLEVHADTFVSVGEAETVHDHDENEDARSGDGEPDDVRRRLNSLKYAEVGDGPGEEESEHDLPGELGLLVLVTTNVVLGVVHGARVAFSVVEGVKEIQEEPFFCDVEFSWITDLYSFTRNLGVILAHAVGAEVILVGLSSLHGPRSDELEGGEEVTAGDGDEVRVEDVDSECGED